MSNVISSYINGNHRTTIYTDGTKVKETGYYVNEPGTKGTGVNRWVETDSENFIYEAPENITIKIIPTTITVSAVITIAVISILKIDTLGPLSTTRNSTGYYLYYLRQYKSLKMKRALYYLR